MNEERYTRCLMIIDALAAQGDSLFKTFMENVKAKFIATERPGIEDTPTSIYWTKEPLKDLPGFISYLETNLPEKLKQKIDESKV